MIVLQVCVFPLCKHLLQPLNPLYCLKFKVAALADRSNAPKSKMALVIIFIVPCIVLAIIETTVVSKEESDFQSGFRKRCMFGLNHRPPRMQF